MSSLLSQLRLFEWNFQIPSPYSQSNIVKLYCISLSLEEARKQVIEMLTKFEELAEEKNILEQEKKKHSRDPISLFNYEVNHYAKLKEMYACNINYQFGCHDSSIDPRDYTLNLQVIKGHEYYYKTPQMSLENFIKTTEPTIKNVNLISFEVGI